MKKHFYLLTALLGAALLTGCAETPESSIVKQKGSQSIANYKEATEADHSGDGQESGGTGDLANGDNTGNPGEESAESSGSSAGGSADDSDNSAESSGGSPDSSAENPAGSSDSSAESSGGSPDISAESSAGSSDSSVGGSAGDSGDAGANGTAGGDNSGSTAENSSASADSAEPAESEDSSSASENALAKRLGVPEHYTAETESTDGTVTVTCDAEISVPDVDRVGIYHVGQMEFSQDLIDTVTEAFFGDAEIFSASYYYTTSKDEALQKLNELKAYQAEGNTDPYGYIAQAREEGAFSDGSGLTEDDVYNLQEQIDYWEELYEGAPETVEKAAITPGFTEDNDESGYQGSNYCICGAETDGVKWVYNLQRDEMTPISIQIQRLQDAGDALYWNEMYDFTGDENSESVRISRDEAQDMAGITADEAQAIAEDYLEKLGLTDFSVRAVSLSIGYSDTLYSSTVAGTGWYVSCTRSIDGFPVTDEQDNGASIESMESTIVPWYYEKVYFYINSEGLQEADIRNLYEIGEAQVGNVEMLSFSEIDSIFQKMMIVQNVGGSVDQQDYHIDEVRLGYARIYDPAADNTTGLLVPVWDFFGTAYYTATDSGGTYSYYVGYPDSSFLTVNAADGTIIDRGLGY